MKRKKVVVTLLIVALNVSLTQNVLAEESNGLQGDTNDTKKQVG